MYRHCYMCTLFVLLSECCDFVDVVLDNVQCHELIMFEGVNRYMSLLLLLYQYCPFPVKWECTAHT